MRDLFFQLVKRARERLGGCRNALLLYGALAVPAAACGYALFQALYRERIVSLFAGLTAWPAAPGGMGAMLLFAAAPPLLFGAAMLLSGLSAYALPLWCLAVLGYAGGTGMTAGFGGALWSAGLRGAGFWLCLCPAMAFMPLYAAFAMQPIRSLQRRGEQSEEERVQGHVLRCLFTMTLLAVLATLLAALGAYALRQLLD